VAKPPDEPKRTRDTDPDINAHAEFARRITEADAYSFERKPVGPDERRIGVIQEATVRTAAFIREKYPKYKELLDAFEHTEDSRHRYHIGLILDDLTDELMFALSVYRTQIQKERSVRKKWDGPVVFRIRTEPDGSGGERFVAVVRMKDVERYHQIMGSKRYDYARSKNLALEILTSDE